MKHQNETLTLTLTPFVEIFVVIKEKLKVNIARKKTYY